MLKVCIGFAYLYDLQNSKYFFAADLKDAIPFLMFEPGTKSIPEGAGRLSLSSSAEYSSSSTRLCPPSFRYSLSSFNFKPSSILRHRLILSEIGRLDILPCNQSRYSSSRIFITSSIFYNKNTWMYLTFNNCRMLHTDSCQTRHITEVC